MHKDFHGLISFQASKDGSINDIMGTPKSIIKNKLIFSLPNPLDRDSITKKRFPHTYKHFQNSPFSHFRL